jgi:Tfp pilus assembly protein PilF
MPNRSIFLLSLVILMAGCSSVPVDTPAEPEAKVLTGPIYDARAQSRYKRANDLRAKQPAQAIQLYREALEIDASMEPALFNLARLYFELDNYPALYQLSEIEFTNSARFWNLVGVSRRKEGAFLAAREAYEQALTIEPEHLSALLNMALLQDLYLHELTIAMSYYQRYEQALSKSGQSNPQLVNWMADLRQRLKTTGA